jgi:TPR repeat protein
MWSYFPFSLENRAAALLVEAADMGDPDAQYALGCHLRVQVRLLYTLYCEDSFKYTIAKLED